MMNPFQFIYGPVYSWRLGRSLGVDPLSTESKTCNMDCIYCQLGKTPATSNERKEYIQPQQLLDEIKQIPLHFVDYITFSGRGEPTLAKNLGDMIRAVKAARHEKVAVITNGLLLDNEDVRQDLMLADFVLIKLDAGNQEDFESIDGVDADFNSIVEGIKTFRRSFKGKMALQVMVIDQNVDHIKDIAMLARHISPDEVQLNTPLRPSGVKPIDQSRMERVKRTFEDMNVITVFDVPPKEYSPIDEQATVTRHGNFRKTRTHI